MAKERQRRLIIDKLQLIEILDVEKQPVRDVWAIPGQPPRLFARKPVTKTTAQLKAWAKNKNLFFKIDENHQVYYRDKNDCDELHQEVMKLVNNFNATE
jgi:hypothetical protein